MTDFIGYLGGLLIAFALTPQVIKSWKTKSTDDISILWNFIFILGLFFYLIYLKKINAIPLFVAGIVEISLAISLIIAKIKYG